MRRRFFTFVGLAVVMFSCILFTWFHEISSNYSSKMCTALATFSTYLQDHNRLLAITFMFNIAIQETFRMDLRNYLSYIYLGYFVCLCVCVCVSQFVAEHLAILLVLVIKLTKETRRRVWRGRD
jgi:hypothetical protein